MGVLSVLIFGILYLLVWSAWFNRGTRRLLRQHQDEWNSIKACLRNEDEIYDAYVDYCGTLKSKSGLFGACFPKP